MSDSKRLRRLLPCILLLIVFSVSAYACAYHTSGFAAEESAGEEQVKAGIDSVHREEHGWSASFYLSDSEQSADAWCVRFDGEGRFLGAQKKHLSPGIQPLSFDVSNASSLFLVLDDSMIPLCAAKRLGYIGETTPLSYEIHLLLDPDQVLDEDHFLKKEVRDEFATGKKYKSFGVVYLDTADRQFTQERWINRIRFREDKPENGFKVTYKKRYPITDGDVAAELRRAETEGFILSDDVWSPEVEWGYSSMTLSLSAEAAEDAGGYSGIAELPLNEAVSMIREKMPSEEKDWKTEGWGTDAIEAAQTAGPVMFKRYTGDHRGTEIRIEVWEIKDKYITELSVKADDYNEAAAVREELINYLDNMGILLKEDSLKTQRIMDAFFGAHD
ncbi:MAG: hypothetical protein IJG50_02545 [Clostridia bacterium]|nr:hypothetical protein [Clostridia bacterium]